MTKKKILIYTIVFVVSVIFSGLYKYSVANDPAQKFNDACKLVINTTCQQYVQKISAEGKYEESLLIQKVRIKENVKLLKFYKSKLVNKKVLSMDSKTVNEVFAKTINTEQGKNDYYLLKTKFLLVYYQFQH